MVDDEQAMDTAQLVRDHHERVYRYAFHLTGSVADAEDLTQQVFLTAQQKLGQLRRSDSVQSWLFAILRNSFLKGQRKWRPIPAGDIRLDVNQIPIEALQEESIDPEQLQEAIRQLPESYRVVLAMFYYEDLHYREIAQQLNVPIGTVMSRLARAKSCLRAKLFEPERQEAADTHRKPSVRRG
jgi:RNA polymerase sigma-70 factor (ECF subfamily)